MTKVPGIIIASPNSSAGKTMITLGLLRAFKKRGINIQPFKNGPDYIDPGFHKYACGRNSYNLDTWAMSESLMNQLHFNSLGSNLIITEGSMGFYDGVSKKGVSGKGMTAELSEKFGWPLVLVLNVSGQAQSATAIALGFAKFKKNIKLGGVILNFVASKRHEALIKKSMRQEGIEVLGSIPRKKKAELEKRHLGLIQADEIVDLEKNIEYYSNLVNQHVDIEKIKSLARSKKVCVEKKYRIGTPGQKIAIASDKAFSFIYPHLIDNWKKAGSEILPFSPLNNEAPDKSANFIWLPGGYPELYGKVLSNANNTKEALRKLSKNIRIHGECGGYMTLGKWLIDENGVKHKMFGLLGLTTSFQKRSLHLGYRTAKVKNKSINYINSMTVRGHEYHYTTVISQPDKKLYDVFDANGKKVEETGSYKGNVSGTFFHLISRS